jgi:hypothetical protein
MFQGTIHRDIVKLVLNYTVRRPIWITANLAPKVIQLRRRDV